MNSQEKILLSRIENLRKKLNASVGDISHARDNYSHIYDLSAKLDRLIYQYMKLSGKSSM